MQQEFSLEVDKMLRFAKTPGFPMAYGNG